MSRQVPLTKSVPRARAAKDEHARRVQQVIRLMARGTWHAGRSHVELAEEWKSTTDAVEKVAALASKVVRHLANADQGEVRALLVMALDDIRRRALDRKKTVCVGKNEDGSHLFEIVEDPDCKAATSAIATQAQLLGLVVHKVEAKTDVSRLTPEQARDLLAEATARAAKLLKGGA